MSLELPRWASVACCAWAFVATPRAALADSHRVAAIDPDAELTRALEVALSTWDATVLDVRIETPGAAMPIAVERARAIALEQRADVVVWVSSSEAGYALWIYDVDSDHASARALETAPPFEPATAAAVALAVKTLLRGTVVAPPPERFGAAVPEATWMLGVSAGAASRFDDSAVEARFGLHASMWPRALGHRWGVSVDAEDGPGNQVQTPTFAGTLDVAALRLAVGFRARLSESIALEPSLGGALQLLTLDGTVSGEKSQVSVRRLDVGFDPRLGFGFAVLGGRLVFEPWIGVTLLERWQRFHVHGVPVAQSGPLFAEGAMRVSVSVP